MSENNKAVNYSERKKTHTFSLRIRIITFAVVIILSTIFTINFYFINEQKISNINMKELTTSTKMLSLTWDDLIKSRCDTIKLISVYYSTLLSSADDLKYECFAQIAKDSCFDYIEFVDLNGYDHNVTGSLSDARDREYYIKGMTGETGIETIYDSRGTHETMVLAYSPVYYDNEIIGVILGAITTTGRIAELLNISYQDNKAEIYLCDPNGYILAISEIINNQINVNQKINIKDYFNEKSFNNFIIEAIESNKDVSFISNKSNDEIGCVISSQQSGWKIVSIYPKNAHNSLVSNFSKSTYSFITIIFIIFIILGLALIFEYQRGNKAKIKHSQEKNKELKTKLNLISEQLSIVEALSRDMTDVYIIDINEGTSTILKSNGVFQSIENRKVGQYQENWNKFIEKIIVLEDRKNVIEKCNINYVMQELEEKNDFSFTFQVITKTGKHFALAKYARLNNTKNIILMGLCNIDERTQAEVLKQALEVAEHANNSKTVFLSNMSHDIRTPMNAIHGYTSLAKNHLDDKNKIEDYLNKIENASDNLIKLINQMLEMSKIESGKLELMIENVDTIKDLQGIINVSESIAQTNNINFSYDISNIKNRFVLTDSGLIARILTNIIGNAMKYTKQNSSVSLTVYDEPDTTAKKTTYHFIVKDTGIGMRKEFLEHIFEAFSREHNYTSSGIQGTGLGMSIVKRLVDVFNGTINIESELGKGTTVYVSIDMLIDTATAEQISSTSTNKHIDLNGIKILLVDDNSMNLEIAQEILQENGVLVTTANDGHIAYDIIKNSSPNDFDLILMDIQMPTMNGYDTTKAIRNLKNNELANIPIIAMTANAFEEDRKNAFDAGMNDYISKPIDIEKMKQIIFNIINKK